MNRFEKDSEVYKMIQENQETCAPPRQSCSFCLLQAALDTDSFPAPYLPSRLSPNAPSAIRSSVTAVYNMHTCKKCGTSIMNQAVWIQEDHYWHPACYVCTDCGLSLKMHGHFQAGNLRILSWLSVVKPFQKILSPFLANQEKCWRMLGMRTNIHLPPTSLP